MRQVETGRMRRAAAPPPPRHRSWWRSRSLLRRVFLGIGIVLCLAVISSLIWFFSGDKVNRIMEKTEETMAHASLSVGLSLQNIYLEGKNHTKSEQIIKAMGVNIGQPLLTIPLATIKKRLEKIDWIKSAVVERQLPNTLRIRIIERNPVVMWQNAGQIYLVDDEGTLIVEDNLTPFKHLMILVGSDAPLFANQLLTMLKQDMELYTHVASAIRIGERRWNIRLAENIEIKLPEENPEEAWHYISDMAKSKKLFNRNIRSIDLRVQGKLYVNVNKNAATAPHQGGE